MDTDRNLLFAVLALQMDFVRPDGPLDARHAWMRAKSIRFSKRAGT